MKVAGYTISELSKELKITPVCVRQRLLVAGIKPILSEKVYPAETLKILREVKRPGRPRKGSTPQKGAKKANKK
jgi:hypothetical protein